MTHCYSFLPKIQTNKNLKFVENINELVVQFKCFYFIMLMDSPSLEVIVVYTFNWLIFEKYFAVFDGGPSSGVCFWNCRALLLTEPKFYQLNLF